jgi:hypothetical protein
LVFTKQESSDTLAELIRGCQCVGEANWNDTEIRISEIKRLIQDFKEKFKAGTSDVDSFMSMTEIELMWNELQIRTNNVYSDMVRELMSEVEERDLIRKKKENTNSRA